MNDMLVRNDIASGVSDISYQRDCLNVEHFDLRTLKPKTTGCIVFVETLVNKYHNGNLYSYPYGAAVNPSLLSF